MTKTYKNIAITSSGNKTALEKKMSLSKNFGFKDLTEVKNVEELDLIIAVGGDGLMLHLLHQIKNKTPIYGVNCGTIGFLMNSLDSDKEIIEKISLAEISKFHALKSTATDVEGNVYENIAINEVSILRKSSQAVKIKIKINKKEKMECLIADGILVSTPIGSTAYNFSAGGSIIPFGAEILALTPISPFRPRKWNGALLPSDSQIHLEVIDPINRPASINADFNEIKNAKEVTIIQDKNLQFKILFDKNHSFEERIINEQFAS